MNKCICFSFICKKWWNLYSCSGIIYVYDSNLKKHFFLNHPVEFSQCGWKAGYSWGVPPFTTSKLVSNVLCLYVMTEVAVAGPCVDQRGRCLDAKFTASKSTFEFKSSKVCLHGVPYQDSNGSRDPLCVTALSCVIWGRKTSSMLIITEAVL